ncbi:hypothetical protein [Nocardia mangyaensis]|uniref:hypothetical protein n=1 Tax=Nocardia mangyaensis TaxID=2213200 RepID=UPI0012ECAA60|nr:hypothetical protein [Nocardia mangyaensis]
MSNNSTNLVAIGVGGASVTAALWGAYATVAASSSDVQLWAWPTWVAIAALVAFGLIVIWGLVAGKQGGSPGISNIRQQSSGTNSPNQISGGDINNS